MTISEINAAIANMSDSEAVAFAKEACDEYGGEACTAYKNLKDLYGEDGSQDLKTFNLVAIKDRVKKNPAATIAIVILSVLLVVLFVMYLRKKRK